MKLGNLEINYRKKSLDDKITSFDNTSRGIFIPIFGESTFDFNGKSFYIEAFNSIPELHSVIDLKATMHSKVKLEVVRKGTTDLYPNQPPIARVLRNPNWYQSQREFLKQIDMYRSVFGNEFWYFMFGVTMDSLKQISAINPFNVTVNENNSKPLFLTTQDELQYSYKYNFKGKEYPLTDSEILHLNDNNVSPTNSELIGTSKIESLRQPLKNIFYAYDTRGFLLKNRGAINILSNDSSSTEQTLLNLSGGEKENLQNEMRKYGTLKGQWQTLITNMKLKVQQITPQIKEMMLFEEVEADFMKICDAYGMDSDLFANVKGATFENKKQAEKRTYESTIIPESLERIGALNQKLGTENKPYEIIGIWDLQIFSDNKKERAAAIQLLTNGLNNALNSGAITVQQYQLELQRYGI